MGDLRFVVFTDSSFDPKGERHHQGWIIGYTNQFLNQNKKAPVSIALWRSRKLPRIVGSPQLVETYTASYDAAECNWVKCLLLPALYSDYNIVLQRPGHWSSPERVATVLRTDRPEVQDPLCTLVADSKGVFDALNNELPQDDKKSAMEMPSIEQLMTQMFGRFRWVPHNFNPTDALTKIKGAHLQPCLDLLSSGMYQLKTESANLAERAAEKEKTGRKA